MVCTVSYHALSGHMVSTVKASVGVKTEQHAIIYQEHVRVRPDISDHCKFNR